MIIKINNNIELLDYLKNELKFSKTKIKRLLINKQIFINNIVCDCVKFELKKNDVLKIITDLDDSNIQVDNNELFNKIKIIYQDEYLMILDKPSGLLVHYDKYNNDKTLEEWIKQKYQINIERSGIVHRLDKDTSGLMIIAKTIECFNELKKQFQEQKVIRKYQAIVLNNFNPNDYIMINKAIGHTNNKHLKMTTSNPKNPKEAITILKALKQIGRNYFLVECELKTGRTHQIRVHMNYINHPILNDPLYGVSLKNDYYNQYLYASYLSFIHPITFLKKEFSLELPLEFKTKIKELDSE